MPVTGTPTSSQAVASTAAAIAEHAGTDTWKTWAGRKHGDDTFQVRDLVNGVAAGWRHMVRRRRSDKRAAGKTCPICDDGDPEPDAVGKRWLRLYCGCTVCSGCVRGWNLALLDGGDGVTSAKTAPKLKCPVCTTPLRRMDAAEVLRRLPDVSQKWDLLTRDALLRSMPDFRSCPKCPGGGFTTPECLAPRHEAIVVVANELVAQYRAAVLSLYAGTALLVAREGSPTYIAALAVTVVVGARVLAQWAARAATAIVSAPLMVECPECTDEYLLQGYGETLSGERQTDDWIHQHTRPCPACGSPIQKSGGCNAMVCSACSSPFCWACMRAKSVCNHFECANGSPFADKQTTGGRNGQPLAVNTPAAHTAALVDLTNFLGMIYMTVACGALSASLAGEPTFSSPQWLVERSGQLAVLGLRGLLYLAVVAGGGVLLMIVYRAYDRHRGSRRWGR